MVKTMREASGEREGERVALTCLFSRSHLKRGQLWAGDGCRDRVPVPMSCALPPP